MKRITVLLVDDHAVVRAGLRALLGAAPDMQVVGEAANGQQAVREAQRLRPEVVLLDIAMPVLNGVEAARQIAREVPTAKVLILSSYSDALHLRQAIAAGAAGYLMKQSAAEVLLQAIRQARDGGASFSPLMFKRLLKEWREEPPEGRGPITRGATLSCRQAEVLQLIAEGYCIKQIAALLFLSIKTAEKHRESLMRKLDMHKTSVLTRYAVDSGVVESNRAPIWPARRPPPSPEVSEKAQRRAVSVSWPWPAVSFSKQIDIKTEGEIVRKTFQL